MPLYDYKCPECNHRFEAHHSFSASAPPCPECNHETPKRVIRSAPAHAKGALTHAGDGHRASKEQLQDKWREETPKLRKKLRDKLGDDAVNSIPTLNHSYDD